ncbi:MAG: hypothetical protein IKL07_02195 [Clostridium sp.]|nr:hypothetical protein [Clostridium sp.]
MIKCKKRASSSIGYVFLFLIVMLLFIISMYMTQVAKLMTHQHHLDDALADSVLASLVADDVYYFETFETTGTPVVRLDDVDESYEIFKDCMMDAVSGTDGFYYNFSIDTFICYEVEGSSIRITTFGNGVRSVTTGRVGAVRAPTGEAVTKTSAYGKVRFDIKSILDGSYVTKTKDIYCALEINE